MSGNSSSPSSKPSKTDAGLRGQVKAWLARGATREDVLARLQAMRHDPDLDEDVVLDVMDFVAGWASPHMKV